MRNAVSIQPAKDEEHIVSVIVHARPESKATIEHVMDNLTGVERITQDEMGKYVLVISAPTARQVMERIEDIQDVEGVLNAAMVAHHTESATVLDEQIELSEVLLSANEELKKSRSVQ